MKINWAWLRRRFWEFRVADSTYGRYFTSFTQWIVTVYTLYILRVPFLEAIFASIVMFAIIFAVAYIPTFTLIGHFFHREKQYPTEVEITALKNPFLYKLLPGKETAITYPTTILRLKLDLKLWKKLGLVTAEEEKQLELVIAKMEKLQKGETLQQ